MGLSNRQTETLLGFFDAHDQALRATYIKRKLILKDYKNPDVIIRDAINEGVLQVDSLVPVWLSLSEVGEEMWMALY